MSCQVVAALIWREDRFLICRRPANKKRALLYEFVGGKVESDETHEQALRRECFEELAIEIEVGELFMQIRHAYPDITIDLFLYQAYLAEGSAEPQMLEHADLRWIRPDEIDDFEFCPADCDILEEIKRVYG